MKRYFDLMYDSDVSHFDRVFRSTAQLHGVRHGEMRLLTAQAYRDALGARAIAEIAERASPERFF